MTKQELIEKIESITGLRLHEHEVLSGGDVVFLLKTPTGFTVATVEIYDAARYVTHGTGKGDWKLGAASCSIFSALKKAIK